MPTLDSHLARNLTRLLAGFVLLAIAHPGPRPAWGQERSPRPNIIFVLADDMGPGDLSCYGGKLVPTPNIDRLAAEGIRFEQYYSAAPICSPSRVGCFTGMFPARWQITSFLQERKGNRECEQRDFLDPQAPSVARALKKSAGYATAHFGKWHMGGGRDVQGAPQFAAYGFDEHAGTWESPEPHPDITATNWIWSAEDKVKRWDRTAFFVDKTLDFLRRHKGQPAFVNVWLDDVHTPWVPDESTQPPPRPDTPEKLRKVLIETDRQIGRLMDGLRERGIDQQTLLIFASDNGALPTFKGDRSAGLRGSKLSLYEGGIRLPFIVHWPGHAPGGRVDNQTVIAAVDLLPTFCALGGAQLPGNMRLDGQDQSDSLHGKPTDRKQPLFWEYGRNDQSFRYPAGRDHSPNVAMREGRWKLLINADGSGAELYDVVADRAESANKASDELALVKRMSEQALAWRKALPK